MPVPWLKFFLKRLFAYFRIYRDKNNKIDYSTCTIGIRMADMAQGIKRLIYPTFTASINILTAIHSSANNLPLTSQ